MAGRAVRYLFPVCLSLWLSIFPSYSWADDYAEVSGLLFKAKDRIEHLSDYTLTLTKQERIGGTLLAEESMFIKFKNPFSLYIKTLTGKHRDREIIYVEGKNNNKMIVSPGGVFGGLTARISPDSVLAKRESRHTVTEAGLPKIIDRMASIVKEEKKKPGSPLTVTYLGEGYCSPEKVVRIRIENSSYAPKTEIAFDVQTLLPVLITSYDTDGSLLESYRYREIKTNVGLTDVDFDPKNPGYHF